MRSRGLTTTFRLKFIKFDYNASHEKPLRSCAAGLGINYEVIAGVKRLLPHFSPMCLTLKTAEIVPTYVRELDQTCTK